jgi:type IV secretion system protein VirB9
MRRPIFAAAALVGGCASLIFGQTSGTAAGQQPVSVKRQPPPPTKKTQPAVPPILQKYDFGAQLQALQHVDAMTPSGSAAAGVTPGGDGRVPKDFRPKTDVPLSPTAIEAVRMSETWRGGQVTPAAGPDGRVMYAFGAGLPVVVCAPLRVCIIELQAGERIVGAPQIGDAIRWNVSPGMYGDGDEATQMIVLKPQEAGLDTNLLIATDRRAYYMRLVSKQQEYVARVAFRYPEEENSQKWKQHLAEQKIQEREAKRQAEVIPALITAEKLNFGYKVTGSDEHLRPVRVFDDGAKTYIQMKPEMQNREAPILVVLGADGKGEMTNYRVREQTYIVDRLFDRARLVLGSGKKAQKVEISREPKG